MIKDILDEWVRGKDEGCKHSRAGKARRKEELRQQQHSVSLSCIAPLNFEI